MMNPIKVIDERISRKLASIRQAFRGVVTLVKAAGAVQLVQGEGVKGEQVQGAEMFQQFGYTSNPPEDSMFILLPLGGKTGHGIIIATEHGTYRLKNLESGETAIYNQWGDQVLLKANRRMQLVSSVGVDIDSPQTTMSGNLAVQGNIVAQGDISDHNDKSMAGMREVFNTHEQAVSGSTAAAPIGHM
ncbi:phage baseplate assembly protein V [Sideroxydans lithotrophicus]|uniref:Phage baseplate assembly protein V n=1 Tax=Sideroxydans lithotrophicus (strain ES-1) TaxID=580332 RepID=D5CUE9_SIDLE|nr:phage baseplate assembly protein V [Sideroxydans lithotrophicus]ADE10484.1 phage baseplate assembly protein V [Sideroxydans lithotrophicus ES-1]